MSKTGLGLTEEKNNKVDRIIRYCATGALEAFALVTLIICIARGDTSNLPICLGTLALVLVPEIVQRLLRCKINLALYIVGLTYAVCPLLGDFYELYYTTEWWDKLLHTLGGAVFAILGVFLFELLCGRKDKWLGAAVFAFCFSMTLSVLWEFVEFGCDTFLGTDMQQDTIVTSINSYFFGESVGKVGSLTDIGQVSVDGVPLPFEGYLDIGLLDTMTDMLVEFVGALAFFIFAVIDRGRHPFFTREVRGGNGENGENGENGCNCCDGAEGTEHGENYTES